MKKVLGTLIIAVVSVLLISFISQDAAKPWEVPTSFKAIENPVSVDAGSVGTGGTLYEMNCANCHGKMGLGDGVLARRMETFPGDFSGEAYQSQSDGEHFYKTKFGRGEMPAYENNIPDEDIWHMVNYMRTFKKQD